MSNKDERVFADLRLDAELGPIVDGVQHVVVRQEGVFDPELRRHLSNAGAAAQWHPATRTWEYEYRPGTVTTLRELAQALGATLTVGPKLEGIERASAEETARELEIRKHVESYLADQNLPLAPYPTNPNPAPWRHQQIAWHWAMRVRRLYLAHRPGTGKSREGVDIARGWYDIGLARMEHIVVPERESLAGKWMPSRWGVRGGVLVVCPKVVVGTWIQEMRAFQVMEAVPILGSPETKARRAGTQAFAHVCPYGSLQAVIGNRYGGIIFDEAHYLTNEESDRWQLSYDLVQHADRVLALSGSPVSNMLPSLFAQMLLLDGGRSLGISRQRFLDRYFEPAGRSSYKAKEGTLEGITHRIARIFYPLRKEDAIPGLPAKIHQAVYVPMTAQQTAFYERVRKNVEAEILTGKVTATEAALKTIRLLQVCQGHVRDDDGKDITFSSAKLEALETMLTGQGDIADRKVIVWASFERDVQMVVSMLRRNKVPCLRFTGKETEKEREAIRKAWNTDPQCRVLVGNIAVGIGVSLHAINCVDGYGRPDRCYTAVFYGLNWSCTALDQAGERIHRGDLVDVPNAEPCLYRYLLSADLGEEDGEPIVPIDVRVYEALQEKLKVGDQVIAETKDYIARLVAKTPPKAA